MQRSCTVSVNGSLCKGCGICVEICPRKALVMSGRRGELGYFNPELRGTCVGCRLCEWYCPDFAMTIRC